MIMKFQISDSSPGFAWYQIDTKILSIIPTSILDVLWVIWKILHSHFCWYTTTVELYFLVVRLAVLTLILVGVVALSPVKPETFSSLWPNSAEAFSSCLLSEPRLHSSNAGISWFPAVSLCACDLFFFSFRHVKLKNNLSRLEFLKRLFFPSRFGGWGSPAGSGPDVFSEPDLVVSVWFDWPGCFCLFVCLFFFSSAVSRGNGAEPRQGETNSLGIFSSQGRAACL